MRDILADRVLAEVMRWLPEDVAKERPDLQALATFKYDEYQQFSPGMRFVESLALWLAQFESEEEYKKLMILYAVAWYTSRMQRWHTWFQ